MLMHEYRVSIYLYKIKIKILSVNCSKSPQILQVHFSSKVIKQNTFKKIPVWLSKIPPNFGFRRFKQSCERKHPLKISVGFLSDRAKFLCNWHKSGWRNLFLRYIVPTYQYKQQQKDYEFSFDCPMFTTKFW